MFSLKRDFGSKVLILLVILMSLVIFPGCGDDDDPNEPSGDLNVFGFGVYISYTDQVSIHGVMATVYIHDKDGNPITNATVKVDDTALPYSAAYGYYENFTGSMQSLIPGQSGDELKLTVDSSAGDATLKTKIPGQVTILQPNDGAGINSSQDLQITWSAASNIKNYYISVYDQNDNEIVEELVSASTTSYTVNASLIQPGAELSIEVYAINGPDNLPAIGTPEEDIHGFWIASFYYLEVTAN